MSDKKVSMVNLAKAEQLVNRTSNHYLNEMKKLFGAANMCTINPHFKGGILHHTAEIKNYLSLLQDLPKQKDQIVARGGLPTAWTPLMVYFKNDLICQMALFNIAFAAHQFEEACIAAGGLGSHRIDRNVEGNGMTYTSQQVDQISKKLMSLFVDPDNATVRGELKQFVAQRASLHQSTVLDLANLANDLMSTILIE